MQEFCGTKIGGAFEIVHKTTHPTLYNISWIQKGPIIKVTKVCRVSLFIRKFCSSDVLCDVVDMDTSHILIGGHWQLDVNINYRGRDNSCMLQGMGARSF